MRMTILRIAVMTMCFVCANAAASPAHAQATPPASGTAGSDELLAEMRGLRADINRVITATARAQILVGRLQLQEQRLVRVNAQLADVRGMLSKVEAEREAHARRIDEVQKLLDGGGIPL